MNTKKLAVAVTTTAFGVLMLAAPVSAHVTITPESAVKGSEAKLTFNLPAEEDTATATKLEIDIPTDHPIASISVEPHTGWTYVVEDTPLPKPITTDDGTFTQAVSKITWTATNGGLKPGEFDEFVISAAPLPTDVNQIEFKALQTYSNGDVVRWIEDTPASGDEPEHPAPVLKLTSASADNEAPAAVKKDSDHGAFWVGVAGVIVGAIALGVGLANARTKKP